MKRKGRKINPNIYPPPLQKKCKNSVHIHVPLKTRVPALTKFSSDQSLQVKDDIFISVQ